MLAKPRNLGISEMEVVLGRKQEYLEGGRDYSGLGYCWIHVVAYHLAFIALRVRPSATTPLV